MPRNAAVVATLSLLLAGCGGGDPAAQPLSGSPAPTTDAPSTSSAPSTTTSATPTPAPAGHRPPAPASANVEDCFDGDCTLLLTGPATVPLDAAKFHYPAMQVTAISATSLSYSVTYPHGGSAQSTVGPGPARGGFGFRDFPAIKVGLAVADGAPALVLQPGTLQ